MAALIVLLLLIALILPMLAGVRRLRELTRTPGADRDEDGSTDR
jgi:hypothetical protein